MGQAAAGGVLASLALACGDERAVVSDPDGGPPQHSYSDGVAPQMDGYYPPTADSGAAPSLDLPPPQPPDIGLHDTGGMPDQPPAPPDMWPQFSDGLPQQPDVYWPPPTNDAGGAPLPPAPKDGKK